MQIEELPIEGAYVITPTQHGDSRGLFFEWFKSPIFTDAVGHPLTLGQANCSVSSKGTLRGIHYADVPPGQAKYVTCLSGAVVDIIVDIRVGSPTFGAWEAVALSTDSRRLVYLSEGLGHGFVAFVVQLDGGLPLQHHIQSIRGTRGRPLRPRDRYRLGYQSGAGVPVGQGRYGPQPSGSPGRGSAARLRRLPRVPRVLSVGLPTTGEAVTGLRGGRRHVRDYHASGPTP